MAIEKMRLLSVVGKEENINSFILQYLLESGLQPENAIKVFEKGWRLSYFNYDNTPREIQKDCQEIEKQLGIKCERNSEDNLLDTLDDIKNKIDVIKTNVNSIKQLIEEDEKRKTELENQIKMVTYLKDLNINLEDLYTLKYMRFRYGRILKDNYEKIKSEIEDIDAIVFEFGEDEDYLWILYLTTENLSKQVDSFFNIAKFERNWIPSEIVGKPLDAIERLKNEKKELECKINENKLKLEDLIKDIVIELPTIKKELELYSKINTVKRYMAHDAKGYFYIVGWLPLENLEKMIPELEKDDTLEYVVKLNDEVASVAPTHLKNNRIFKPFEYLVEMYGLPNYTELDPTVFVAITAFLMFGFMFGDVGHGFIFLLLGLVLSKKKSKLGPILSAGGISSMIFGVLYGSVFGSENIIPQLLIRPMDNIQTMLIAGISFGAILILIAMVLNIINQIRNKNISKIFFDSNGIAGIIFYLAVLITLGIFMLKGKWILTGGIAFIVIVIPLILIFFEERISNWINKKKKVENVSFVEKFFEMFEMILSFISNTISFVRLAAFAINHVGLSMAVYILADMVSASGSLAVLIIGNAIIIALEGLIVSIQVLRLEYYELFSRFYSGDGKEYEPIEIK